MESSIIHFFHGRCCGRIRLLLDRQVNNRKVTLRYCLRTLLVIFVVFFSSPAFANSWSVVIQQGRINNLIVPEYTLGDWKASDIEVDIVNSVQANNQQARITFSPGSHLSIKRVIQQSGTRGVELKDIQLDLADALVTVDLGGPSSLPERTRVSGNLRIEVAEIRHPSLKPQRWWFQGGVSGTLADLELQGQLSSKSGLTADLVLRNRSVSQFAADIRTTMAAQNAGEALTATLLHWPELLSLDSGELTLQAGLRIESNEPLAVDARLDLADVSGVIDRTAVTNLSGRLMFALEEGTLTAALRDIRIGEIDSGIGIGPIQLLANYEANLRAPFKGQLAVQQATAEFLGGRLRVAPRTVDLSNRPWHVPIDVYDLSLERLLQVYPAEGFSGSGTLTGRIPVAVTDAGVRVDQGSLRAVSPGGKLIMPAERLQAMLGSSNAMDLVVQALQNFHYSVLQSTIDYDEEGKLALGLRLEGENPDLRGGQPVVLNINLEEDIPALLTSLQLSGRVNEAVTERVRQRLQQSGQEAVP